MTRRHRGPPSPLPRLTAPSFLESGLLLFVCLALSAPMASDSLSRADRGAAVPGPDAGASCVGLSAPVEAPLTRPFAPVGRYDGHWGIDFGAPREPEVTAAAAGDVTFAGVVVDNRAVTIDRGGGLSSSYSYLDALAVQPGDVVDRATVIGVPVAGDHDHLHFSVRLGGRYVDPELVLGCQRRGPRDALRLTRLSS